MLKRQRPTTPPPSSLGDPPSFLPDGPIRPLQTMDPSQPCAKRQRTQPPSLDGAVRGWLASEPVGPHWESDGEEDWTDDPYTALGSPLPLQTVASQYKDANILLHELHVLNQHRLLFSHSPQDRPVNPSQRVPLPTARIHVSDPIAGHKPAPWADGPFHHPEIPEMSHDGLAGQCAIESKGSVEEVQCVRQRYEGANRLLGSVFLSRRRKVEGITSSANHGPSI